MWWLEILESFRSNYCRNSKKSWKQTAGWKYQKALNGIEERKFYLELRKQNIAGWPFGGIALSESSWKQTTGWKYQKALDGIDVAKTKHCWLALWRNNTNHVVFSLSFSCRPLLHRPLPPPPPKTSVTDTGTYWIYIYDVKKHKGIVLEGPWVKKTLLNLTKKNMSKKVHPLVLPSLEKSITKELEN
jgi:hypothetical protein